MFVKVRENETYPNNIRRKRTIFAKGAIHHLTTDQLSAAIFHAQNFAVSYFCGKFLQIFYKIVPFTAFLMFHGWMNLLDLKTHIFLKNSLSQDTKRSRKHITTTTTIVVVVLVVRANLKLKNPSCKFVIFFLLY